MFQAVVFRRAPLKAYVSGLSARKITPRLTFAARARLALVKPARAISVAKSATTMIHWPAIGSDLSLQRCAAYLGNHPLPSPHESSPMHAAPLCCAASRRQRSVTCRPALAGTASRAGSSLACGTGTALVDGPKRGPKEARNRPIQFENHGQ